ncbi:methyltransferase domain-containing protein [Caldimonas thermodepolymerans]|jgi:malonyl-CoA O-methyltransferase|uniref:Malonyl-CoA O-methyltransferase n=1 Tax=Caldimonas thermodepolymerans TaxID=215580 RepID=A0AA46DGU3_9BURK|nr:methyltransferase domain-containing protein [Caldimonas thermodepolymerans]TCP09015.1 malonyl-CoA O-methyltransferase [Caldimonas thermodepolymerans]UZG47315.1 methyltransferase domain-containing protein [Caldimonas thermodepolymerans]
MPVSPRPFDPAAAAAWWRSGTQPPWLHAEVARRMAQRLEIIRAKPQRVLDWWSSRSGSLALLQQAYPQAELIAVEPDEAARDAWLAAQRRPWWSPSRWGKSPRALSEAEADGAGAQLLWANMVLHWMADPAEMIRRWHRALAVDGFMMFSCLGPDTARELRALHARHGHGPAGAEFVDMHDLGDMLVHAGFADPVMDMERITLTWSTPEAALAELRTLGRNTHPQRHAGLRTPRWKRALMAQMQAPDPARVAITFEIVYGHAFKGAPRAVAGGETRVSLQDMRTMVRSSQRPR